LIVAKDVLLKEPIAYNFIVTETKEVYRDLMTQIADKDFTLNAVILDSKPGIISLFEGIPLQICPRRFIRTPSRFLLGQSASSQSLE